MKPYFRDVFYNPSSLYPYARKAKEAIEQARTDIARLMSVQPQTIVFTSGGTESSHLAILGTISKFKEQNNKKDDSVHISEIPHIISSTFEHPAVSELLKNLESKKEITVSWINPESNGIVLVQKILEEIKKETILICLIAVNNEIGTIQPVRKVYSEVKKIREKKENNPLNHPYVYSDAAQVPQALGINRDQLGADMVSFDSAKIYGPKGVGMLYIESHAEIKAIQLGGGQERGMRSGTEAVPLIVGFAEAMKETIEIQKKQNAIHAEIQKYFIQELKQLEQLGLEYEINGSIENDERIPQNLNICFRKNGKPINSEFAVIALGERGIMVSPGASCGSNKSVYASESLEAIGKNECSSSSIRFTFGREVKKRDIDYIVKKLSTCLK
jgi:cysteine desulfurase